MARKSRTSMPEFQQEAVRLVRAGCLTYAKVEDDLGVNKTVIRDWCKTAEASAAPSQKRGPVVQMGRVHALAAQNDADVSTILGSGVPLGEHLRLVLRGERAPPAGRPTGNAVAERTIGTMKQDRVWLADWRGIPQLREALAAWKRTFNEERPHQSLRWLTPAEYRAQRLGPAPDRAAA